MIPGAFTVEEVRQLLDLALRNPDPELVGLALNAALAASPSHAALLGDAVEATAGEDIAVFFGLMRRYGLLDLGLQLLSDRRAAVRRTVATTLRWIQDASVPPALERATADTDPSVRAAAAAAFEDARVAGPL